jgi:hypothetical protein
VVWSNWNNRFDIAPMPNDRSTLAGSLSLRVLRKASVVDPMCAMIAWPRHGTALASPLALYVAFFWHPCWLSISVLAPVSDPISLFFSCWHRRSHTSSLSEFPPPFSFSPLKLAQGAHHGRRFSPPRDPLVIPLHAASISGALHHHLCLPGYKCPLACLSSIPPQI